MKIVDVHFDPRLILGPADLCPSTAVRSPGLHLSAIYRDMEDTISPRGESTMSEDDLTWYRSAGFLWEHAVDNAFKSGLLVPHCVRPGEVELDGITGSPDLVDVSSVPWRVVDTKATFKSVNKILNFDRTQFDRVSFEKHFYFHTVQLKGYCKLLNTLSARLLMLFVCGGYAPPRPQVRQLDFEFSQLEVDKNWQNLKSHAQRRGWLPAG